MTISTEATALREEIRAWGLAHVRPLAREADRLHGPPPGVEAVLAAAPTDLAAIAVAALPSLPEELRPWFPSERETGYVLGALMMEVQPYGDSWVLTQLRGAGIAEKVVKLLGTPEQQERWVGSHSGTFRRTAFALTEPHFGSDPSSVATTATRDGDGWVINGRKMYCSNGASADYAVVFATIDKEAGADGIRAFVVPTGTPGYVVGKRNETKLGIRSHETSELLFEQMAVPADALLGGEDAGGNGLMGALGTLNTSRPLMGAWALGIAGAALDAAREWFGENADAYSARRRQLAQDDLRRMDTAIAEARTLVLQACELANRGVPNRREASTAKAVAPAVGEAVCRRVIELVGPEAVSEQHLFEKWFRDVRIMDIFEGSGQIQRLMVSRSLMGRNAVR
ncbi:acyl-CoA dehydrogenase family protein [Nocardioides humi]|uniref:Acyl-CoA dehydrogenase family protein n=1 Tax=Nocardioides humi TaxID=449461 RepID=A0ABN2BSI1_9ACTN|nr:acyl-CoA dehydrogenase family protein [Nocardioides humi]